MSARRALALLLAGITACALPLAVHAQPQPVARTAASDPYAAHVSDAARRFGVPEHWIRTVMRAESAGDPRAISPKGAMGLMQIMPATWANLRVRLGLGRDPFDVRDNILAGAATIRELFDRYGSPGFLAAYNAGPARYEASLTGRPLPAETRAYVASLAPRLGGGGDAAGPFAVVVTDALAWTRAPLFAVQPDRASAAAPVSAERTANDAPAAPSVIADASPNVRDPSGIAPQSGGLFVARTHSGAQP